jgi:hypothetical protein
MPAQAGIQGTSDSEAAGLRPALQRRRGKPPASAGGVFTIHGAV